MDQRCQGFHWPIPVDSWKNRGVANSNRSFSSGTSTFDMCSVSHVPHVVRSSHRLRVLCWNSPGQRQETVFQFWWRWIRLDNQYQLNKFDFWPQRWQGTQPFGRDKTWSSPDSQVIEQAQSHLRSGQLLIAASNCACETHAAAVRFTYTYIIFILL